jgi:hypothetical protein
MPCDIPLVLTETQARSSRIVPAFGVNLSLTSLRATRRDDSCIAENQSRGDSCIAENQSRGSVAGMKSDNTEIKRGGSRKGAGRKKLPPDQKRVAITIRLSREKFKRLAYLASVSKKSKTSLIEMGLGCFRLSSEIPPRSVRRKPTPAGNFTIDV